MNRPQPLIAIALRNARLLTEARKERDHWRTRFNDVAYRLGEAEAEVVSLRADLQIVNDINAWLMQATPSDLREIEP